MKKKKKQSMSMLTYGAMTPRTSGDLVSPDSLSHPSSSSDNFLAEK